MNINSDIFYTCFFIYMFILNVSLFMVCSLLI